MVTADLLQLLIPNRLYADEIVQTPDAALAGMWIGCNFGHRAFHNTAYTQRLKKRVRGFPVHSDAVHQLLLARGGIVKENWLPALDAKRLLITVHGIR